MKKRVIIYLIILLIIPISLTIYFGLTYKKNTNTDLVIYEAENAEKLDISSIGDTKYTYLTIFTAIFLMGGLYIFVAKRKE